MPFRREKSCRKKVSYAFVMKPHGQDLQDAVSSRKNMNQNRMNRDSNDFRIIRIFF
jgi:hypothetical protein